MRCKQVRRLLSFQREWTAEEAAQAGEHLVGCPACQAVARQYELMDRRLDRLAVPASVAPMPPVTSVATGTPQRASGPEPSASAPRQAGRGMVVLALAALIVVAAVVLGATGPRPDLAGEPALSEPTPLLQPVTHTVAVGENVWSIAWTYGLQPETIVWANPEIEKWPDLLQVGQVLLIPPVDGVLYTVQAGDSLEALAERYGITVSRIVSFAPNQLQGPGELAAGSQIMLPGGRKETDYGRPYSLTLPVERPAGAPVGTGRFSWPTTGVLSQRFWEGHQAIDVSNRTGTPVRAADAGYVVLAGRDALGYGNQLIIDHGNGYLTRYAHLDSLLIRTGDSVQKTQQIGTLGATGRVTGPHLHFEIWKDGVPQNPLDYLPGAELE